MIDIINAHVPYYDDIVLITGFLNPRETPLNEKVKVKMCKLYDRSTAKSRFYTWFIFWIQSVFYIFLKYRNYNLYFVSNPPINVFSARLTKRPFAFLVYDLYPEALSRFNYLKESSILYKLWSNSNSIAYNKAQKLFTISSGIKKAMLNYKLAKEKIEIVPIWTNADFFKKVAKNENIFLKLNDIENKFIIGYSGNLGKSHPLEKLIDLANILKDQKDILFLIIGEGDKKNLLQEAKQNLKLENVKILGYQETEIFPHVLHAMDIGVITLDSKASDLSVPSKIYNLMSAGKPVMGISSESSELAKLIKENDIGKNFDKVDIDEMKSFIISLKNNDHLYKEIHQKSYETGLKFTPKNAMKMILK